MALTNEDLLAIANIIDVRLLPIETDVKSMKGDIVEMKGDIENMKGDIVEMKGDIVEMKGDIENMKGDIKNLQIDMEQLKPVKEEVAQIQLILENDINMKIEFVAEGHSILNRKLDEVLKSEKEKEHVMLRVTTLESDMRRVKKRLEMA